MKYFTDFLKNNMPLLVTLIQVRLIDRCFDIHLIHAVRSLTKKKQIKNMLIYMLERKSRIY